MYLCKILLFGSNASPWSILPSKFAYDYGSVKYVFFQDPYSGPTSWFVCFPALWFHNVISLNFGVAVNVFWKHLSGDMYDSKDTYGNKDPNPVTRAFQIVDRAIKTLEELPSEYRDFYARRLIARIEKKAVEDFPT